MLERCEWKYVTTNLVSNPDTVVGIDIETNGKPWYSGKAEIRCAAAAFADRTEFFDFSKPADRTEFSKILTNPLYTKVGHNLFYFDFPYLVKAGAVFAGPVHDTIVMARCYNNLELRLGLDYLGEKYCGMGKVEIDEEPWELPIDKLEEYNRQDAEITWLLYFKYVEDPSLEKWLGTYQREVSIWQPINRMQELGLWLDYEWVVSALLQLGKVLPEIAKKWPGINLNSSKQVNHLLYETMKMKPHPGQDRTKDGWSVAEDWLIRYPKGTKVVDDILEYRSTGKVKKWLEKLVEFAQWDDRVHPTILPYTGATGRMSCKKPNAQQIPGAPWFCRKAFKCPPGYTLESADYRQMELRMAAGASGEERLLKAFREGGDPHGDNAKRLEVTRDRAKIIIFAVIYGVGAETLAKQLRVPLEEAERILVGFTEELPKITRRMRHLKKTLRDKGHIVNLFGRLLRCEELYQGMDYDIQSTGADILKDRIAVIWAGLEKHKWYSEMVLPIHDELVFAVQKKERKAFLEWINQVMPERKLFPIELPIDIGDFYKKG